jgi:nucleotide-binding universal stress UspA family protein
MWTPKTVLHPTDFSEGSKHAFTLACDLARHGRGKVVVIHAVAPAVRASLEIPLPPEDQMERKEEARRQLHRIVPDSPDVSVEHRLIIGEEVAAILDAAKQDNADIIVMGTHGRSGLKRMMLGSIAEQVLRRSECPVLTIRGPSK